jgi:hypothetical protein
MTVSSVLDDRYARWANELFDWGYVAEKPPRPCEYRQIRLRAVRSREFGPPAIGIDIHELWLPGSDPHALGTDHHGCHLHHSGWSAQIGGPSEEDTERHDVDREKPKHLIIHRHPIGQPNKVRQPAALLQPEAWLAGIDEIVAGL